MIPDTALLRTESKNALFRNKICGLHPLERNILVLSRAGIKNLYLDLSPDEKAFYENHIKKHLKNLGDSIIHENTSPPKGASVYEIPTNAFLQIHYFNDPERYFAGRKGLLTPQEGRDIFRLDTPTAIASGARMAKETIIRNTRGFIAQKINKRISIPISSLLANTRIHPNYLTIINMITGILSAVFLLFNEYLYIVLGGLLFQTASVLDGVDGEVAKFTFKVSKIGGWLDTISDNMTLLLFLGAASYLFFINTLGYVPYIFIGLLFTGLLIMLSVMISFLHRHTDSASLVTYDKEFLQKLPADDRIARLVLSLKYITKKEFFSIVFFLISLTGMIYLIIPLASCILITAAFLLLYLSLKYRKRF